MLRQQKNGFAQRTKKHSTSRLKREAATENYNNQQNRTQPTYQLTKQTKQTKTRTRLTRLAGVEKQKNMRSNQKKRHTSKQPAEPDERYLN